MAPLSSAFLEEAYGQNSKPGTAQGIKQQLQNNQQWAHKNDEYQEFLKKKYTGVPNFHEVYPKSTFGHQNYDIIDPRTQSPNPAAISINNSREPKNLAWTDIQNKWPSNQGFSMYNRFQTLEYNKEYYTEPMSNNEQIISLLKELILIIKIILFILILFFIIKIF